MNFSFFAALLLQSSPAATPATPVYESEVSQSVRDLVIRRGELGQERLVDELETLAEDGDDSALELLGEMHLLGALDTKRDPVRGCIYFERIGSRRPDALHNLATCYFSGEGRERDYAKARSLYRAAAQGGWTTANCAYGNMLIAGQGGSTEVERGLALCREAAERGDADAQTDLGGYLLVGEVTARDPVAAREYLLRAGKQGQANASFLLGQIYEKGDGTVRDPDLSRDWFERAHAAGRPDAAYRIMRSFLQSAAQTRDGETVLDVAFLPHIEKWARIAAQSDPDPANRETAASILNEIDS